MSRHTILIVEDDPGAAESFVPMLGACGYEVRVAVDGKAGVAELAKCDPAALIVDLHLPDVDGVTFVRRLRESVNHRHLPVAIVTGDYLLEDRVAVELTALGAGLYFKPLWEDDLVDIVRRLIGSGAENFDESGKIRTSLAPI